MSEAIKLIKIVEFKDNKKKYRMCARKFMLLVTLRKYSGVLNGRVESLVLDEKVAADKNLIATWKANADAYSNLTLSCTGEVIFGIVEGTVMNDLPEGDTKLAWEKIKK